MHYLEVGDENSESQRLFLKYYCMTLNELANELNEMYTKAKDGEKVTMIYLFGIKYNKEIKDVGISAIIE